MNRRRRGGLLVALAMAPGLSAGPLACSSSAGLSGEGGPCSQFSDCQLDLICGKGPNGTRICTSDPSSLEPAQGQAGADAAGNPANMAAGDASAGHDATMDSSSPAVDAEALDTSTPVDAEVRDAGKPLDSGKPADTGAPEDTGTPPQEAAPMADAGGADAAGD